MTQQHLVMVPKHVPAPRGAVWAADVAVWAAEAIARLARRPRAAPADTSGAVWSAEAAVQAAQAIEPEGRAQATAVNRPGTFRRRTPTLFQVLRHKAWRALEEHGRRRAARELLAAAQRWQDIDPEIARGLRAAAGFDTSTAQARHMGEKP
jgi:hypothetical protein